MIENFIKDCSPHGFDNDEPPHDEIKRHEWESKILYSVKDSLSNEAVLLDYGCGKKGTMRFSLWGRFPSSNYIGIDPVFRNRRDMGKEYRKKENMSVIEDQYRLDNLSYLSEAIEKASCVVAGSVFTHLGWESIENVLDQLNPLFNRGGEFGFTIFLGDRYVEDFAGRGNRWYKKAKVDTYLAVVTTIEQYENYCEDRDLQFTLLPYDYKLLHNRLASPETVLRNHSIVTGKTIGFHHFCNIRKKT